ncbi:hypothetical protein [Arthrobacter sp. A5]|uniref:hypothetical protein n=1 Tax=Arthrobacter sp. A5 TaxID=576926 RepID=UPI003DA90EEA
MDQYLTVNDLLVYSGTLLIAAAMFAIIGVAFLGCLLLALAARGLQWASLKLTDAVLRQWAEWHQHGGGTDQSVQGIADPRPTTEAVTVLDSAAGH